MKRTTRSDPGRRGGREKRGGEEGSRGRSVRGVRKTDIPGIDAGAPESLDREGSGGESRSHGVEVGLKEGVKEKEARVEVSDRMGLLRRRRRQRRRSSWRRRTVSGRRGGRLNQRQKRRRARVWTRRVGRHKPRRRRTERDQVEEQESTRHRWQQTLQVRLLHIPTI